MMNEQQTKAQHTPGPWVVHPDWPHVVVPASDVGKHRGGSVDPDREADYFAKIISDQRGSEFPEFSRSRVMPGEDAANARLIAAAPAYAKAWELVPEDIKERIFDTLHTMHDEWVTAALAKAEA